MMTTLQEACDYLVKRGWQVHGSCDECSSGILVSKGDGRIVCTSYGQCERSCG